MTTSEELFEKDVKDQKYRFGVFVKTIRFLASLMLIISYYTCMKIFTLHISICIIKNTIRNRSYANVLFNNCLFSS